MQTSLPQKGTPGQCWFPVNCTTLLYLSILGSFFFCAVHPQWESLCWQEIQSIPISSLLPLVTGVHSSWHLYIFCELFYVSKHKGLIFLLEVTLFWQLAFFLSLLKNFYVWTHRGLWQPQAVSTHICIMDSKPQKSYSSKPQPFIDFGHWLFHASSLSVIPTSS